MTLLHEIPAISCFSGSAQLDIGAGAALHAHGYKMRTILYVEKDAHSIDVLKARIRDGLLPDAPIWDDVRTVPCSRYRGMVGAVIGGFPCQDLSVAGKQRGFQKEAAGGRKAGKGDGESTRSGLFFSMLGIAVKCGSPLIFLENVPGISSTSCPLPDGGIRPAAAVVSEALAEAGYLHRWLHLSADNIGAPHGRERWWCIASMANPASLRSPFFREQKAAHHKQSTDHAAGPSARRKKLGNTQHNGSPHAQRRRHAGGNDAAR